MKLDFKNIMLVAILLTIIIGFIFVLNKMSKKDDENYKKCLENHSVKYCEKNILGVY